MGLLRRLFPLLFVVSLLVGGAYTVMTGTVADALIQGSVRDALAAETLGDMRGPVREACRYLQLHETVVGWLRFLAPNPDASGLEALDLKLQAVDLFAGAVAQMQRPEDDRGMAFAVGQLSEVQGVSTGVWRPGQALVSAIVFWVLFCLTVASGISRLRERPAAAAGTPPDEAQKDEDS